MKRWVCLARGRLPGEDRIGGWMGGLTLRSSCLNRVERKSRWKERKRWKNEER